MSAGLSIKEFNRIRDEKTVYGYIRNSFMSKSHHIPIDIINLCLAFYHIVIREIFQHYNPANYQLSNDDMTLTNCSQTWTTYSVCYGSQSIPSLQDQCIYSWKFKILHQRDYIAIGIDETKYLRKHNGHFNREVGASKSYALWNDQRLNRWDYDELITAYDAPILNANDIVCMTLNLTNRTLSFQKNNDKKYIPFENISVGEDIEYCMGVFILAKGDSVEMLSCELS